MSDLIPPESYWIELEVAEDSEAAALKAYEIEQTVYGFLGSRSVWHSERHIEADDMLIFRQDFRYETKGHRVAWAYTETVRDRRERIKSISIEYDEAFDEGLREVLAGLAKLSPEKTFRILESGGAIPIESDEDLEFRPSSDYQKLRFGRTEFYNLRNRRAAKVVEILHKAILSGDDELHSEEIRERLEAASFEMPKGNRVSEIFKSRSCRRFWKKRIDYRSRKGYYSLILD